MKEYILNNLRRQFPVGSRVELVKMDDTKAPPIGTKGTVKGVDDIGSIMVQWDNGSTLNVVYGEDECKVSKQVKTICYGKEKTWETAEDAINFFFECMLASEGSERDRYANILRDLKLGFKVCSDEKNNIKNL